jgi:hypothetical protein
MELTKRRKPKADDSSTERLEDEEKDIINDKEFFRITEISKNKNPTNEDIFSKEIYEDFYNFTKKHHQHFSEINSTIHFTGLNSKDLAISKYKMMSGGVNLQNSKSISIVNVLDELNNNNNNKYLLNNVNNINTIIQEYASNAVGKNM